jgi:hypothetical protein
MEQLDLPTDEERAARYKWVEHLKAEAGELRRDLASDE